MILQAFKAALLTVGIPVYHNIAHKQEGDYIVWGESGEIGERADDGTAERGYRVAVDFYTRDETTAVPAALRAAVEGAGYSLSDAAVDFDEETGYTRYLYTAEVC